MPDFFRFLYRHGVAPMGNFLRLRIEDEGKCDAAKAPNWRVLMAFPECTLDRPPDIRNFRLNPEKV
jgi:hypothetical protein